MKRTSVTAIAVAAVAYATTATAQCPMHNEGIVKGYERGIVGYTRHPFIRTGGYTTVAPARPDIVDTASAAGSFDTASAAGSFDTLVEAVKAAGLVETLKGDGPFTVFAPTDEAFAKLPAGTLDRLLADPEQLARVLKYHVVPGRLDARGVTSMSRLSTVEGSPLAVADIAIVETDIITSNGVIHVIDEVLIPQT